MRKKKVIKTTLMFNRNQDNQIKVLNITLIIIQLLPLKSNKTIRELQLVHLLVN